MKLSSQEEYGLRCLLQIAKAGEGASLTIVKSTNPGDSGADTFGFTSIGTGMSDFTLDTNAGDQNQVTTIKVSCHSFTHVDAQRHYFGGTPTITKLPSTSVSIVRIGWSSRSKVTLQPSSGRSLAWNVFV